MKYLEELNNGDFFILENNKFLLTADFKQKRDDIYRMCVNTNSGLIKWVNNSEMVEYLDLYFRDVDGNILPLKEITRIDIQQ